MNRFALVGARTVSEAAAAVSTTVANAMTASPDAMGRNGTSVVKAGGIDLLDLLKENLLAPGIVVSLKEVRGLDAIAEEEGGGLRIGSMVSLAKLADHPILRQRYPALARAVRGSASPQIRNVATLGGNLLQRAARLVFPGGVVSLPAERRRALFRDHGRKSVSRHFQ